RAVRADVVYGRHACRLSGVLVVDSRAADQPRRAQEMSREVRAGMDWPEAAADECRSYATGVLRGVLAQPVAERSGGGVAAGRHEPDHSRTALAYLERNGSISVIPRESGPRVVEISIADGVQTARIELS